jgi:hypothetical protein
MTRAAVVLLLLVVGLAGPAIAGPERPIADVKSLAGEWRAVGGTTPAAIRIQPDGSYEGVAASGAKTTGKVMVTAGKASYRSTGSEGTVTLSREGGKDVLTFTAANQRGSARLERVR